LVAEGKLSHDSALLCFVALPLLWFLVEIVTMLTNGKRRALHDFIAGTVVIRTNATEPGCSRNWRLERLALTCPKIPLREATPTHSGPQVAA
jgi:hypothetical protein